MNKYFMLTTTGRIADIYIFGDITSWEWLESDVSSYTLSKELQGLDVDQINVHISSYGGEVAEGLAIYNTLRSHKAKIRTVCDGFACSAASVIFMAGDERVMNAASLLMIHNAWTYASGNADELRRQADDLDKISTAVTAAYTGKINITAEKLKELLDAETWLLPTDALDMGFATSIVSDAVSNKAVASAKKSLYQLVAKSRTQDKQPKEQEPPKQSENKLLKFFNALA